ncbi:MAG TPA: hypothetical protein EYP10_07935, partial [Armatimonadetes bacterium]|nr:hypothetical protein [Armatimonadota bacterium]
MIGSTWLRLAMWLTGITAELAVIYALALSTYKALKEAHLPESVRQRLSVARRALRRIGALGIALTILVGLNIFAICMLKQEPFSTGQTLGWGFLIGWVASLIMFVGVDELTTIGLMPRGSVPDASGSRLRVLHAGALSGALLGWSTGIVLATWMIFRGYPNHALIGVAIGFCFAALATGAPLQYTQYTALTDAIQVHKSGNASRRFQPLQRGWERLCANLLLIRALVCTCIVALTSSLVLAIHHRNLPTASVEILLYPLALMSMLILVWGVATA